MNNEELIVKSSQFFYENQHIFNSIVERKKIIDYTFAKGYRLILNNEASLIKEIANGDDRILTYFSIYYFLYKNGFLSNGNVFKFGSPAKKIIGYDGFAITEGQGVCRNISMHLYELLCILKPTIIHVPIGMSISNSKSFLPELDSTKEIVDNIAESYIYRGTRQKTNISNSKKAKNFYELENIDHLANLLNIENNYFIFDSTNFYAFWITDKYDENCNCIYDLRTAYFYPNYFTDEINSLKDLKEYILNAENNSKSLSNNMGTFAIPAKDLQHYRRQGIELCKKNLDLIKIYCKSEKVLYKDVIYQKKKILHK